MTDLLGDIEVETLLKVVLALVAFVLVVQAIQAVVSGVSRLFGPFLVQLAIAAVIVLWLLDRL